MSTTYGSKIVNDGLVLYFDAGNTKSYPGSGTSIYDLSGNGNTGTLNGVGYNSDNCGSLTFDGYNRNIVTSSSISLTNYTFEFFCKAIGNSLSGATGYNTLAGYASDRRLLYSLSSSGILLAQVGSGSIQSSAFATRNEWNQIVFSYQSSNITGTWYINGESAGSLSDSAQGTWSSVIYIGSYNSDNYHFNGSLSNVKIYNRALSLTEIEQNYNALRGRYEL